MRLRGLNWRHRRAVAPMRAVAEAARQRLGLDLVWEEQPLAGFEHGLTAGLADRYDLVVFDHPFCGDIAAGGFMRPLEGLLGSLREEDFAGPSLDSYRYGGHLWALPIDAATQAAVLRPDLMAGHAIPTDWAEVLALGRALRRQGLWLGLPTLSPHGVLALLSLMANLGAPLALDRSAAPFRRPALREAARLLREAAALARPDGRKMNAIDLHEAMVSGDDIAYCPLAYTYLTYAEADMRRPLRFAPFAGPRGTPAGTVLGGTGLGVTRACASPEAAAALLAMLADAPAQVELLQAHHGQPGRAEAWAGNEVDRRLFGGAHAALRSTLDQAWVRPRFRGFVAWQEAAGNEVHVFLEGQSSPDELAQALERLWWRQAAAEAP